MKKSKRLFLSSFLLLPLLINGKSFVIANGESNIYQDYGYMHSIDFISKEYSQNKNFITWDDFYFANNHQIRLNKSIEIKKYDSQNYLSIFFEYENEINQDDFNNMYISFNILSNNKIIHSTNDYFEYGDDMSRDLGGIVSYYLNCNRFGIILDVRNLPNKFTIMGNQYSDSNKAFNIRFNDDIKEKPIKHYLVSQSSINGDEIKVTTGLCSTSSKIYYDNSTYKLDINYDNRPSLESILNSITAYDIENDTELKDKQVSNDTYSNALKNNEVGQFSFEVTVKGENDIKSTLKVNVDINDSTPPEITEDYIEISYTKVSENGTINLADYLTAEDNYDGLIPIDDATVSVSLFNEVRYGVTATDSNGNYSEKMVTVHIIDDVKPIIEVPEEIVINQYDILTEDDLLKYINFIDEGSGIKSIGVSSKQFRDILFTPGQYEIEVYCIDKYDNKETKTVPLEIKKGIGPVFFINEYNVSINNASLRSAKELISQTPLKNKNYQKVEFIDKNYSSNYEVPGEYETRVICIDENGNKEFYRIKVNILKQKKNVFVLLADNFMAFISTIIEFFKYIFHFFFH